MAFFAVGLVTRQQSDGEDIQQLGDGAERGFVIVPLCCLNTTKHRVRKDPVDPLLSGQYLLFCLIKLVPLMQALYKLFALVQRNTTTILVKAFIEPLNKSSASVATDPSSQHTRSSSNTRSHHSLTRRLAQLDWV